MINEIKSIILKQLLIQKFIFLFKINFLNILNNIFHLLLIIEDFLITLNTVLISFKQNFVKNNLNFLIL